MRRSLVLVIFLLGLAPSAFAQSVPRVDVSGGWQMLQFEDDSMHGWNGDVAVNLNRVVGLVGGIDGLSDTFEDSGPAGNLIVTLRAETRVRTFLGGARLNLRTIPRVVPFVEVLGGAAHVSDTATITVTGLVIDPETTEASDTHSALQIGGGVTLGLSELLGVRVAVARRRFFMDGESSGATRVAVGAALRF
jgi:outer membrane protein with beta-barrel domain